MRDWGVRDKMRKKSIAVTLCSGIDCVLHACSRSAARDAVALCGVSGFDAASIAAADCLSCRGSAVVFRSGCATGISLHRGAHKPKDLAKVELSRGAACRQAGEWCVWCFNSR